MGLPRIAKNGIYVAGLKSKIVYQINPLNSWIHYNNFKWRDNVKSIWDEEGKPKLQWQKL